MLAIIKEFFQSELHQENSEPMSEDNKRLACAALLVEVAIIDQEFDHHELAQLQSILQQHFDIPATDCEKLISLAQQECDDASSMYQFTQLVNKHCSDVEKFELIVGMWKIAFADGDLDKYEEYIIRKVSDLIYVAHGDFIRAKHIAKTEAPPSN